MTVIKTRKMISNFKKKGFSKYEKDDHKGLGYFYKGELTHIRTIFSHGISEYDDDLLQLVMDEIKLTKKELIGVVDCSVKKEKLMEIYIKKGELRQ